MTLEQFIADTLSVTDYLRNCFGKEKIYLMAHSGGSFIGLQAVARAPEPYRAYVGVAQMVHQLEAAPVTMASGALFFTRSRVLFTDANRQRDCSFLPAHPHA